MQSSGSSDLLKISTTTIKRNVANRQLTETKTSLEKITHVLLTTLHKGAKPASGPQSQTRFRFKNLSEGTNHSASFLRM